MKLPVYLASMKNKKIITLFLLVFFANGSYGFGVPQPGSGKVKKETMNASEPIQIVREPEAIIRQFVDVQEGVIILLGGKGADSDVLDTRSLVMRSRDYANQIRKISHQNMSDQKNGNWNVMSDNLKLKLKTAEELRRIYGLDNQKNSSLNSALSKEFFVCVSDTISSIKILLGYLDAQKY